MPVRVVERHWTFLSSAQQQQLQPRLSTDVWAALINNENRTFLWEQDLMKLNEARKAIKTILIQFIISHIIRFEICCFLSMSSVCTLAAASCLWTCRYRPSMISTIFSWRSLQFKWKMLQFKFRKRHCVSLNLEILLLPQLYAIATADMCNLLSNDFHFFSHFCVNYFNERFIEPCNECKIMYVYDSLK